MELFPLGGVVVCWHTQHGHAATQWQYLGPSMQQYCAGCIGGRSLEVCLHHPCMCIPYMCISPQKQCFLCYAVPKAQTRMTRRAPWSLICVAPGGSARA